MIIAAPMPSVSSFTLNQGTLLSASAAPLYDKKPGTAVLFSTPASTAQTLRFTLTLSTAISTGSCEYIAVRIDNVRAQWSATPLVAVTLIGPSYAITAAAVFTADFGYPSRTILIPKSAFSPGFANITGIQVDVTNATGSNDVTVGEVFVSTAYNVPISKYEETPTDPSVTRRAKGNTPWPLFDLPFRAARCEFGNVSRPNAFVTQATWGKSLRAIVSEATRASGVLVIPFWRDNRASAMDQDQINAQAFLSRLVDITGFESNAEENRWPAGIDVEELL